METLDSHDGSATKEEEERIHFIVSRLQEIDDRLNEIHSGNCEYRAKQILEGLQFSEERMHMTTRQLSGRGALGK